MLAIILLGMFIAVSYEAIQQYLAEKYAQKKVYGEDVGFFSFMLSNHPVISVIVIIFIILIICAFFMQL